MSTALISAVLDMYWSGTVAATFIPASSVTARSFVTASLFGTSIVRLPVAEKRLLLYVVFASGLQELFMLLDRVCDP